MTETIIMWTFTLGAAGFLAALVWANALIHHDACQPERRSK